MISAADTLIFIATYNEKENLALMAERLKNLGLDADLLLLDDNSPDGTGRIADEIAAANPRAHVIHRPGKLGIGSAHLDGIRWAYAHGYKTLVTMDCDFTHQPEDIPRFIEKSADHDVVIGTRFVNPGSLKDWDPLRKVVTHLGHFLTVKLLKMPYDASGAFRLYRLDRIPEACFDLVTARSYSFFFQSLLILSVNGFSIHEIPILLPARTCGHSKMTISDAAGGFSRLAVTYFDMRIRRGRYFMSKPIRRVHERSLSA